MITIKKGVDVNTGANASAEGGDEDDGPLEEGAETVNNVVYSMRMQSSGFDKKGFMMYIKGYMKAIKAYLSENNPDRLPVFEAKIQPAVKKILEKFSVCVV